MTSRCILFYRLIKGEIEGKVQGRRRRTALIAERIMADWKRNTQGRMPIVSVKDYGKNSDTLTYLLPTFSQELHSIRLSKTSFIVIFNPEAPINNSITDT